MNHARSYRTALLRGLALLLGCLLVACGGSTPELQPIPRSGILLAFGDSLTFGTGAPPEQSYPAHLQRLSQRKVINAGVPGEVSSQGLARLPEILDRYHPDLLLLCHGGNDILRGAPHERLTRNLVHMVELAQQRGIQVLLIGVPERSLFLRTAPLYEMVAQQTGIPVEDEVLTEVLQEKPLKSDRVHPNGQGYLRIAAAINRLLRERGALP